MKNLIAASVAIGLCVASSPLTLYAQQTPLSQAPAGSWAGVDSTLGRKGALQPGEVVKYSFPRGDMAVVAQGVTLKPTFALGSWVAFKRVGAGSTIAMGDLVLAENEVGPVMVALQAGGVGQTALHNHVLGESPRVMYMHIHAHGNEARIARAIHDALSLTKTPAAPSATAAPPAATIDLDTTSVAAALGYQGRVNGGVYQVSVPRAEKILEGTVEIPASMGLATAINFQPTGGGNAAITGDFVMSADEVNRVIRVLLAHHIQPTGLHSHMLIESPRLFFMHFWANDNAITLAQGLKGALAEMHVKPSL